MYLVNKRTLIKALDDVAATDRQVAEAIALVGYPEPRTAPGGFPALLSIIVNQQISKEAAKAILGRLEDLMPGNQFDATASFTQYFFPVCSTNSSHRPPSPQSASVAHSVVQNGWLPL